MKKQFVNTVLLFSSVILFTACSASVSSDVPKFPVIPDAPGDKPAAPDAPAPGSPYANKVTVTVGGTKAEYAYVEALDLDDGKNVKLRFFTIPPRGLCNVDSLIDSSSYQTKFSYLTVNIPKTAAVTKIAVYGGAAVGKRGDTFPVDNQNVSGEVTVKSSTDERYQGWLNLTAPNGMQIQGNFDVVGCYQTQNLLQKMKLDDLSQLVPLRYKDNGAVAYEVTVKSSYRKDSERTYAGFKYISDYHNFQIYAAGYVGIKAGFSGMSGGSYVGAGNTSCESSSPGPVTAEIVGNRIYFGGKRAFFCIPSYDKDFSAGFIEYNPATGKRTLELETSRYGTLVGEF
ncbi:hypothetical protein [Bdellovibrio sp. HCB337]|uniref:hypothetical protein n=1 Tax=Bdellovibrio sp. HCB337 TaxID=3394358 RepID=UPI0039A4936F